MFKDLLGVLICLGGIALGLYLGVWFCFVGGIVQFLEAIQTNPINAMEVAIGIAKFFSASLVGWVSFLITFGIGQSILKS